MWNFDMYKLAVVLIIAAVLMMIGGVVYLSLK
jgi:hypothetical protein